MAGGEEEERRNIASRRTNRGGARTGEQGCGWRSRPAARRRSGAILRAGGRTEEEHGRASRGAVGGAGRRRAGRGRGSASTALPTTRSSVAVAEPPRSPSLSPTGHRRPVPAVTEPSPPTAVVAVAEPTAAAIAEPAAVAVDVAEPAAATVAVVEPTGVYRCS
ncbi:hypothetical protein OsJ_11640 [Oryza sativa Japonica Group]|uniref:Uncharacterized protein n=1 Tax=Oryza sativa subsp. japonica TaxID=39947 RepID=A3AK53_ORYSJ|nr:hypothetical protein OsJ_11640 [Oryza sativa Japonica Group]